LHHFTILYQKTENSLRAFTSHETNNPYQSECRPVLGNYYTPKNTQKWISSRIDRHESIPMSMNRDAA